MKARRAQGSAAKPRSTAWLASRDRHHLGDTEPARSPGRGLRGTDLREALTETFRGRGEGENCRSVAACPLPGARVCA